METKLEQIAAKAVKQRPKSGMREIRTPRSVGTGGGRPPPVTRWAPSNGCPYRNREMTTFFLSLRVSGSFKIVRVPLEETDGRELRRPLLLPAAVCRAVSDSGSVRSRSDKGNMVSAGIGLATGLRLAASTRHSNAVLSWPDRLTSHTRPRWIARAN